MKNVSTKPTIMIQSFKYLVKYKKPLAEKFSNKLNENMQKWTNTIKIQGDQTLLECTTAIDKHYKDTIANSYNLSKLHNKLDELHTNTGSYVSCLTSSWCAAATVLT